MVDMDITTPEDIDRLFQSGAVGIKFISPEKSYGHESYFPLYDAILERCGLAVFHTGFLAPEIFEPGGLHGRSTYTDITDMRPAALDRIARAFPDLKIIMAHFGNPWWEEAWKMISSHKNIYADFSGGTCYRRSMDMWAQIFEPDGKLDTAAVGKLCFGTDSGYFTSEGNRESVKMMDFHVRFMERLKVPEELRQKVWRDNILELTGLV
jgi:predicted TIM-barrel fold metal-dependent hydrolase